MARAALIISEQPRAKLSVTVPLEQLVEHGGNCWWRLLLIIKKTG